MCVGSRTRPARACIKVGVDVGELGLGAAVGPEDGGTDRAAPTP